MGRGGIAARKALAEKIERSSRYRLFGTPPGTRVAECVDKYGRWELGHRVGSIVRSTADTIYVHWHGDTDLTYYRQGDARYEVDRGRWRLSPPPQKTVFSALTGEAENASIMPSPPQQGETKTEEDHKSMTTQKKTEEPVETYSAKQVATRIGTDPKTLRKFFRSPKSTFEPVGQGGRYEFPKSDLPAIQKAFDAWKDGKPVKSDAARSKPTDPKPGLQKKESKGPVGKDKQSKHKPGPVTTRTVTPTPAPVEEDDDEELDLADIPDADAEPTEDDLEELDLELDEDDDLDDEARIS